MHATLGKAGYWLMGIQDAYVVLLLKVSGFVGFTNDRVGKLGQRKQTCLPLSYTIVFFPPFARDGQISICLISAQKFGLRGECLDTRTAAVFVSQLFPSAA